MKTLEYYRSLQYKMIIDYEPDDNVFVVRFPELPGCIAHGETPEEAVKMASKVKDGWLEAALEDGWDMPEPQARIEASGRVTVRMPKSLHRDVLELAGSEGISLNQLLVSFIARGLGRKAAVREGERAFSSWRIDSFHNAFSSWRETLGGAIVFGKAELDLSSADAIVYLEPKAYGPPNIIRRPTISDA
jgi:antitoxin HicB